jgi:hypothetical protein
VRARLWCLVVTATVLVAGCAGSGGPRAGDGYVTDARTDSEKMQAVPDVISSGGQIDVVFPRGSARGPGFVLERETDTGWAWHYSISSETRTRNTVTVWTAEEFVARNIVWNSGPGFDSTDPHLIPVPEDAEVGRWRVCTVPDRPSLCAEFDVTNDG